jgi:hypothetical protein
VCASPEAYAEPHRLELVPEGLFASKPGCPRELEVQVFMSTQGQMAALASSGGAVSVLAATWNVGNALPPPAPQLSSLWLRGAADGGEHHLVAVAAQECSYLKDLRAAGKGGAPSSQRYASQDLGQALDTANGGASLGQRRSSGGVGEDPAARPPSRSLRSSQAAASATEAPDVAADEDDEEEPPAKGAPAEGAEEVGLGGYGAAGCRFAAFFGPCIAKQGALARHRDSRARNASSTHAGPRAHEPCQVSEGQAHPNY